MTVFESLVAQYQSSPDVAQLFGVILYTDEHPNIKKVLRDQDYWDAFDTITGAEFAVFSIRPQQGQFRVPKMPGGAHSMMVPIWVEPRENREMLQLFELTDTRKLPMLLLFTEVDGKYLSIQLPIEDTSLDKTPGAIKTELEFATQAVAGVRQENRGNTAGLYAAVSLHHDDRRKWRALKKGYEVLKLLKDWKP